MTSRNKEVETAEENNQQLLDLLEKYDQKLDEMQDSLEIKEVEKLELEEKLEPLAEQASDVPLKASRDTLN